MKRAILFLLAFVVAGCGLFTTRTPEEPDSGSTFIWTPATSIDYLLENFIGTLQILDASNHVRVYIAPTDSTGSGAKPYTFFPSAGLDQASRSIFSLWNAESERSYVAKLKSVLASGSKLTVLLTNRVIDQNSSTATVSADYNVSIPTAPNSGIPSVLTGSLQFQMQLVATEQGTREWRIVSWSDFLPKNGSANTWTSLKVKLSS